MKSRFLGYMFIADKMYLTSTTLTQLAPEVTDFGDVNAK